MREKLVSAFPEFDLIEDERLREGTIKVYKDVLDRYGWTVEDLDRIPFTLLIPDIDITYARHVRGVTRTCHGMANAMLNIYGKRIAVNLDILIAGALLHDIGKLAEFTEENGRFVKSASGHLLRHPFSGVALCAKHNIPEEVLHIIAVHSKEGEGFKRTPEAIILHHADFTNFEPLKK